MPRENRKRGKKHKKVAEEEPIVITSDAVVEAEAGPSWIVPAIEPEINLEAPFGYVDADVKAYFRSVDQQIQTWQHNAASEEQEEEDVDPNEGAHTDSTNEIIILILAFSSKVVLCSCFVRDVWEGETVGYGSRLLEYLGTNVVFNRRLCPKGICRQTRWIVSLYTF